MNERIQKLAVEAEVWANQFEEHWADSPDTYQLFKEKFAELLISAVMAEVQDEIQYEYDWTLADIVTERVKKAFGV